MTKFIIIDPGHGSNTPGKKSPDGRYSEAAFNRALALRLVVKLARRGIDSAVTVDSPLDLPLGRRIARANTLAERHPDAILLSLHTNAAGDGSSWNNASGFSVYVAPNAALEARNFAAKLSAAMHKYKGNRATPACGYNTADFAMLIKTKCPAVLAEALFHDNKNDVEILLNPQTVEVFSDIYADVIASL